MKDNRQAPQTLEQVREELEKTVRKWFCKGCEHSEPYSKERGVYPTGCVGGGCIELGQWG